MKKLSVIYQGWGERWQLGALASNGRETLFEYHPDALRQGLELSPRHLKLRAGAYGDFPAYLDGLPGMVSDALPDGWGRLLMDKQFRRAGRDAGSMHALDRLAFIGNRAMGALVFEPPEDVGYPPHDVSLLALAREVRHIVAGEESAALEELVILGGSPQGARPKALVNHDPGAGTITTDPAGAGMPWLIKFPAQNEHKEVCAIEALYARLAAAAGIDMPRSRYFDLGKSLSAFGVERFDRQTGMRVPMHTLSGLLHADFRMPTVDYTTFLRATRFLTKDEREVRKAYLRCVFNVILHNRDDHAKNVSFCLARDRTWKLSAGYDLTYSDGPGGEHQMDICGEGRAPGKAHLNRLAKDAGIDGAYAAHAIETVASVAGKFPDVAEEFPIRKTAIKAITGQVQGNLRRMACCC
jgi:serine/threonine-protein kinase HipA